MVGQEVSEPMLPKTLRHEALQDVHVGIAIALDENGPLFEDCDVPADDDTIGEFAMCVGGELLHVRPQGH